MIELARGDNQEGPKPLAAADRGMAHRVIEPVPRVLRHREQAVQQPVDLGADFRERGFQLVQDRKSVVQGKSVSVCVDLGGSRIIKKKHEAPPLTLSILYYESQSTY